MGPQSTFQMMVRELCCIQAAYLAHRYWQLMGISTEPEELFPGINDNFLDEERS